MDLDPGQFSDQPRRRSRPMAQRVSTALIIGIFAVIMSIADISGLMDQAASASWTPTNGAITHAAVDRPRSSRHSRAVIIYRYWVKGVERQGRRIHAGFWRMSDTIFRTNQSIVDEFPAGTNVTVYYDPKNPEAAALRVGIATRDYLECAGLLGLLWLATAFCVADCMGLLDSRPAQDNADQVFGAQDQVR